MHIPRAAHPAIALLFVLALLVISQEARAAAATTTLSWWSMGSGLLGGLALFLYGMDKMADALQALAGARMRSLLGHLTRNRFLGAVTGAFITAVLNSSSVTTVLVVGFISAGLMTLPQSIGVIMGANIGSTVTAQLIAFRITDWALLMIAVGFALMFAARQERLRQYGNMLMGLGLLFFGMGVMSDAMAPLRSYAPFLDFTAQMRNPLLALLIGAVFTALVQSSAATTGIAIVMAADGLITLPTGIALAFGANIGTCVTALLASIGKPREALRAALVHIIFNICGVLLWIAWIDELAELVRMISPAHPELGGAARISAEVPRQIANAHTLFNVANTLIFIGLTGPLARLIQWLVPIHPEEQSAAPVRAEALDEHLLATPSLALERVRMEVRHLGGLVLPVLVRAMPAILTGDASRLHRIRQLDNDVDTLHAQILAYLGRISQQSLTAAQTQELMGLLAAINDLENIGDVIETNLVTLAQQRIDEGVAISPPTREVLAGLHQAVTRAVDTAVSAVADNDAEAAGRVIVMKQEILRIIDSASLHQAQRLVATEPKRIPAYTIEIDIIEKLKSIYQLARHMAKTTLPVAVAAEPLPVGENPG